MSKTRQFGGYNIGLLVMKSWVPKLPGHISCASNYDFPIYYHVIEDSDTTKIHGGDAGIVPRIMEGIEYLESIGCKAVMTSCGYFAHFQKTVSEKSSIPAFLSSICLVPFLLRLISGRLLIICYNKEKLTESLFEACGVDSQMLDRCVITDVIHEEELGNIIKDQGHYNIAKAKDEVVRLAAEMKKNNPDISAVLLECTDLPPHAYDIQKELNMPVFDSVSMVKFVNELVQTND